GLGTLSPAADAGRASSRGLGTASPESDAGMASSRGLGTGSAESDAGMASSRGLGKGSAESDAGMASSRGLVGTASLPGPTGRSPMGALSGKAPLATPLKPGAVGASSSLFGRGPLGSRPPSTPGGPPLGRPGAGPVPAGAGSSLAARAA